MGNLDAKPNISYNDWEKVQTLGGLEIYRNKKNNQIAERRIISIDPHFDLHDQLEIYQLRDQNNDSLVRAFGAQEIQVKHNSKGICSGHKKVQVLTERMPYRLNELPQLTFSECLLFLRQSLRAYNKVFRSYGPIHVTKRMIGINYFGQVRCWVNQNWALNHPDHELPTLQSTKLQGLSQSSQYSVRSQVYDARYRDETEMVHNVVAVIEQKCEQGKFPQAFSEQVQHHSVSFRKLTLYLQDFIGINQLFIPPIINYETVCISQQQPPMRGDIQPARQVNKHQSELNRPYVAGVNLQGQNNSTNVMNPHYVAQEQPLLPIRQHYYTPPVIINEPATRYHPNPTPTPTGQFYNVPSYQPQTLQKPIVSYTNPITQNTIEIQVPPTHLNQSRKNLPQTTYNMTSTGITWSTNNNNNLWLKPESTYKPAQNQSNFSGSSYQYSMTNPSLSGNFANLNTFSNYSFGGLLTNTDLVSKTQINKPSSHTTLSNILGSTSNKYEVNNNQNRIPGFQRDSSLSSSVKNFNHAQENNVYGQNLRSTQPNARTYAKFKQEFGQNPLTNGTYNDKIYTGTNKIQLTFSDRVQEGFAFSFDERNQLSSKFPEYPLNNYSNTLNDYGAQTLSKPSTYNSVGMEIQGKYADQFNSLLGNLRTNQSFNVPIQENRRQGQNLFEGKKYKA